MHRPETEMIVDTRSDITLVSTNTLTKFSTIPQFQQGATIRIGQVKGKIRLNEYVNLPIYFITDQGPVLIWVEAYVIPDMIPELILRNDFMDQYRISIDQSESSTQLLLGRSKRYIPLQDSVFGLEPSSYCASYLPDQPHCTLPHQEIWKVYIDNIV